MNIKGYVFAGIILWMLGAGCTKAGSPIGSNYIGDNLNVLYIDTVTVLSSTVLLDSIPTSGSNNILVGNYQDPVFGEINSVSYMEMGIPERNNVALINPVFDSLSFIVHATGYSYGDTTQLQQLRIYALNANLLADVTGKLYNIDSEPYLPSLIGEITFLPQPGIKQLLSIPMSDSLGSLLLNLLATNNLTIANQTNFRNFFKGIAILPGPGNTNLMGFNIGGDTDAIMRLYYHYPGLQPIPVTTDFPVTNNTVQFNRITSDRTGTQLAGLNPVPYLGILSATTNHETFIESGVGIATRISFPFLNSIEKLAQFGAVIKAQLVVQPMQFTYRQNLNLPPELLLLNAANANYMIDTLTSSSGARMNGSLIVDYVQNLNTVYTYDVTNYINALLSRPNMGIGDLLLEPPSSSNATSVDRIVLGDQRQLLTTMKLEIYYIVYKEVP